MTPELRDEILRIVHVINNTAKDIGFYEADMLEAPFNAENQAAWRELQELLNKEVSKDGSNHKNHNP